MSEQGEYHSGLDAVAEEVQAQGRVANTVQEKYNEQGRRIARALDKFEEFMSIVDGIVAAQKEIVGLQGDGSKAAAQAQLKFLEHYPRYAEKLHLARIAEALGALASCWMIAGEATEECNAGLGGNVLQTVLLKNNMVSAGNATQADLAGFNWNQIYQQFSTWYKVFSTSNILQRQAITSSA